MKPRILVIDDEESIRITFEAFLLDEGYEVSTAKDYHQAMSFIGASVFDLVFADVLLPDGKTGIDVFKEVRQRGLDCLVVIITGIPEVKTASEAVRLGAFDYLAKPVVQETLLHTARLALQHRSLIQEKERYRRNIEAVFRGVRDAIISVDGGQTVIEMNEAAENICNLSRDGLGKAFSSLFTRCRGKCLEAVVETLKTNQPAEIVRLECGHVLRPQQVVTATTHPLSNKRDALGAILVVRDETRLAALERETKGRRQFHALVGKSEKMQEVYALIESLADIPSTVLVTGESGTGKELVAEALHYGGERSRGPFVKVNCSALPEGLLESELFGHVRGAFTGAGKDRIGRFQQADGGTIFLDEIGDISPHVQLKLLRVLQKGEFERVGESATIKADVRVVVATNQDLQKKISEGKFREDLYYRLNTVQINLPPLRERREDIPLLMDYFLDMFNKKLKKSIRGVSANVRRIFMDYPWQGNVRELEHALEHACILCKSPLITTEHLPVVFRSLDESKTSLENQSADERLRMLQALETVSWNKAKAARKLGMSRRTIYRKMKLYRIESPDPIGGLCKATKGSENTAKD